MADNMDPTAPWVPREAGQLLSSAAWNDMQRQAKTDIASVGSRVSSLEALLATGHHGVQVLSAHAVAPTSGTGIFENRLGFMSSNRRSISSYLSSYLTLGMVSSHTRYTEFFGSSTSDAYRGYWDFISSPVLQLSLPRRSLVLMRASGEIQPLSSAGPNYYLCMQFILGQSGQRAPVHIPAEATLNCSDIWGMSYRPAAAPNADTWPDWLRDHHNFYMTSGTRWPMCGFTFTGTYTNSRSLDLDEYLELPKGDYSLQLGFSTNGSQSHGAVTLQNLALRAVILPV